MTAETQRDRRMKGLMVLKLNNHQVTIYDMLLRFKLEFAGPHIATVLFIANFCINHWYTSQGSRVFQVCWTYLFDIY